MTTMNRIATLLAALAVAIASSACGDSQGQKQAAGKTDGHAEGEHAENEGGHDEEKEELTLTTEEAQRAGIKVEAVQPQPLSDTVTVTATIRPDQDRLARIAPRIEGRITSIPAKLGDSVRAGQTMATLDSVAIGETQAALLQAQTEVRVAKADLERTESLAADEIVPRKELLRARAEHDKATAAVRTAQDRLRLYGGAPGARGTSGFAVTAPFAGTVIERKATLGELASPAEPMFTLADLSSVWLQAALTEAVLAKVKVGAKARVTLPAYPGETFEGKVSHIAAALDPQTRTVAARIELPNPDGRLKPEMFATAAIEVGSDRKDVITLPDAAILLMQGQPTVFMYEQGAYATRVIEPGERLGGRTVVKSGIAPGEEVVTAGAYALKARALKSQIGHGH